MLGNLTVHRFGSATHETNTKLFPVKSRREFAPDFTMQSSLSFLLSHKPNPCTVWFPTWFLNIISVYTFSKQVFGGAFRGRFWSTFLQYRAVWATEARAPRSFLSIIIVILTLMLTLYFSVVSLKTQIWLSIHLKQTHVVGTSTCYVAIKTESWSRVGGCFPAVD